MGGLVAVLWGALGSIIVPLGTRLLVGLGFGAVAYTGISAALDAATAQLYAYLGGVSGNVITILALARVDDFIAVILSAISVKMLIRGLTAAGSLKQMRFKGAA